MHVCTRLEYRLYICRKEGDCLEDRKVVNRAALAGRAQCTLGNAGGHVGETRSTTRWPCRQSNGRRKKWDTYDLDIESGPGDDLRACEPGKHTHAEV
ncbi:unnamed protein product [Boreogadus saida]